jgi:hypothetical protein
MHADAALLIQTAFDDVETKMAKELPLFLRLFRQWTPVGLARYSRQYRQAEELRRQMHPTPRSLLQSEEEEEEERVSRDSILSAYGSRKHRLLGAFVDGRFDSDAAAVQNDMRNNLEAQLRYIRECRAAGC